MIKKSTWQIKGMQRDLSVSKFSSEYAYENKNIRIMSTDDNTLLSIVNEKGTKEVSNIEGIDSIKGLPIGQATINGYLVLFTTDQDNGKDYIYKIWFDKDSLHGVILYDSNKGNLNFNPLYPIETLSFYEDDNIQKVYWTDGLNQPRVINITSIEDYTPNSFDFVMSLNPGSTVNITNIEKGYSGIFPSGVIQYCVTVYTKNAQESNILAISPLYYITKYDNGGSPEDSLSVSFNVTVSVKDVACEYVRLYSILRTTQDSTPIVKRVQDIKLSSSTQTISFTDTGNIGESIDPTELLYLGGEDISCGTMCQKDNTLFLGNINVNRIEPDSSIREYFRGLNVNLNTVTTINLGTPSGYYQHEFQLNNNSSTIKIFKYLEWYRFGIQFKHKSGKWSSPVLIKDAQITKTPGTNDLYGSFGVSNLVFYKCIPEVSFNDDTIIGKLKDLGYIGFRPIIVYPSIGDREVICQGVLCPTVYNVGDRFSNSPFVQSSWFSRPNIPFDVMRSESGDAGLPDVSPIFDVPEKALYSDQTLSRYGIINNDKQFYSPNESVNINISLIDTGTWAECRHSSPIPGNTHRNAEIQNISYPPATPRLAGGNHLLTDFSEYVEKHKHEFFVDQSIVTLHSPDIEFNSEVENYDISKCKLRIIGATLVTASVGDIDIVTSTTGTTMVGADNEKFPPTGFYKESCGSVNISPWAFRSQLANINWIDNIQRDFGGIMPSQYRRMQVGFATYPWHRSGGLDGTGWADENGYRPAKLQYKRLSNLKFSATNLYLSSTSTWDSGELADAQIFNSNEVTPLKLKAQEHSGKGTLVYYGNVDKITSNTEYSGSDYYQIVTSSTYNQNDTSYTNHDIYVGDFTPTIPFTDNSINKAYDPVHIKYKSTPHAVIVLEDKYNLGKYSYKVLPTIIDGNDYGEPTSSSWPVNRVAITHDGAPNFWDTLEVYNSVSQDVIGDFVGTGPNKTVKSIQYGWWWLAELYRSDVTNRFGGESDDAIQSNQWLPCGETTYFYDDDSSHTYLVKYLEGDTYFQRYDHLKTYPFTLEDENSVTEIMSFMCETRVNLDGRYDNNRGNTSNLYITPENFNKLNQVYNQKDNFFTYKVSTDDTSVLNKFPNVVTWTKTKTAGELIDTWTNITLASTLDFDGDKGSITALRMHNNNILAFQDKGISQILYNENVQISPTNGVPIEIANSGKVTGKRYLSDSIGCSNKWSICRTPNGTYFIDDITKGIFLLNNQLDNISDRLGFHSWINSRSTGINVWNPKDFSGFVTYYDKVNGDVFFISKDECLAFSEPLGQFSSFYSYENVPYFSNILDRGLWVKDGKLWLHNEGDYNTFFNSYQPFYTTVISNPDMTQDKIFNTLEFRADSWNSEGKLLDTTYDTLSVWNEYQSGESKLTHVLGRPSSLKKKFRIWRANIPRDKSNNKDRMRNPWLYLKLSMESENTNKTILHDMVVHYFE